MWAAALLLLAGGQSGAPSSAAAVDFAADARQVDALIAAQYAYSDRLPGGGVPQSDALTAQRAAVTDGDTLLAYMEARIATLADHHAATGRAFGNSWALVPSYADLWIVEADGRYLVDAVRPDSPAARAGIGPGAEVVSVDGVAIGAAVARYWGTLGLAPGGGDRAGFAARTLLAGRRDRDRTFAITQDGAVRAHRLPNLYQPQAPALPPVSVTADAAAGTATIRFNNQLGDTATIAAFDAAMAALPADTRLTIDLRDTPSGGTTTVARAVMGWFVAAPSAYQVHDLPAELRRTGIARQWVEQVLPRAGKSRPLPVAVHVGRWTGSMGEGLAVGLSALGTPVCGDRMAGLAGGIYNYALDASGYGFSIPVERISTVSGQPREDFVPLPMARCPR